MQNFNKTKGITKQNLCFGRRDGFCLLNVVFRSILWFVFFGFCSTYYINEDVFAYSASISTDNAIVLDVASGGTGTSIVEKSINIVSDCRSGYNLTIATPEGSDLYKYNNDTQADNASFTAVDGTSILNSSNNTNKWGYTLTSNASNSTIFSPLSATASSLKTTSQTASPSADINDTFSIYYGVKVDNSVDPGIYQMASHGTIVYYLTMDITCTQYTVAFNANGGTGTVANQIIQEGVVTKLTSADTLTAPAGTSYINAANNTITGQADKLWTFWGWNTAIDGTGDWYKDKEEVEDLVNAGSTITLYAQWKQATLADMVTGTQVGTEKVIDHNLMQDMSPGICWNSTAYTYDTSSSANTPYDVSTNPNGYHTIILSDNRGDTRTYRVTKLPDNLCWMTDNLLLGGNSAINLTPDDTDITSNFTLPASDANDFSTASDVANVNKATVLSDMTIPDYTVNGNVFSGKVTTYYSYAAVTADTSTYNKGSGFITTTSICPKNWDLPLDGQYARLKSAGQINNYYNTDNSYVGKLAGMAPYNFIYGGYRKAAGTTYNTSTFNNWNTYGYFWTSRNASGTYVYSGSVYSSGLSSTSSSIYKIYGSSARCVASQGTASVIYKKNDTVDPEDSATYSQNNVEISSILTPTIATAGFIRSGYAFKGWNTVADGSGTAISDSSSISGLNIKPGSTVTLYAQWIPQYTITYVHNCKSWAPNDSNCTDNKSNSTSTQKINLNSSGNGSGTLGSSNYWTNLSGWKISGWNTLANGTGTEYPVSSSYAVTGQSAGSGITLYAHWVPVYTIQYDGNGASNPNGMGTTDQSTGVKSVKQINVGEGDSVTLLASNFKRVGYGFAGWSTSPTATIGGSDKIYGPTETISAPAYPANGNIITMYAVWVEAEKDINDDPIYLQNFTTNDCNALTKADFNTSTGVITPGSVIALTDKRDNQVYTVAKLADNNCWMVENLRLEHAGTVGNNINDNSVTNESLSQGYGGTTGIYGNFVGLADSESGSFGNANISNSIYKSSAASPTDTYDPTNNTLEDIGTSDYPANRFPRYNSDNTQNSVDSTTYTQNYYNALNPSNTPSSNYYQTQNLYSYGNYYTWAAAMANTNYYTSSSTSESVGTSICPFNWHLPSSNGTAKEYGTLSRSYGGTGNSQGGSVQGDIMSSRFRAFPNNFLYSGYFNGSRGTYGLYWSRSAYNGNGSCYLYLGSRDLHPSNSSWPKSSGFSVRCLIGS